METAVRTSLRPTADPGCVCVSSRTPALVPVEVVLLQQQQQQRELLQRGSALLAHRILSLLPSSSAAASFRHQCLARSAFQSEKESRVSGFPLMRQPATLAHLANENRVERWRLICGGGLVLALPAPADIRGRICRSGSAAGAQAALSTVTALLNIHESKLEDSHLTSTRAVSPVGRRVGWERLLRDARLAPPACCRAAVCRVKVCMVAGRAELVA